MASIVHRLITPLVCGPPEPPRNKVTVVGVGQVGMACAVSILLRVRAFMFMPVHILNRTHRLPSQHVVIPRRILPDWLQITELLASDLDLISLMFTSERDKGQTVMQIEYF